MTRRAGILCIAVAVLLPFIAFAADEDVVTAPQPACLVPGEVPITPETRPAARAAGIPETVYCWNPQDKNLGAAVGEAKQYLSSILCANVQDNYGGAGPEATISKLNPGFAVCAARFLKAANTQVRGAIALKVGGTAAVCVNEGYRTQEKQMEYWLRYRDPYKACDPTNKVCEHTSGLAIDVNTSPNSNYPVLWSLGSQYGVTFYLGSKDPVHFRAANEGCRSTGTQFNLDTPTTQGLINPNTFDIPTNTAGLSSLLNSQTTLLQQLAPLASSLLKPITSSSSVSPTISAAPSITPITNPLTTSTSGNTETTSANMVTNPLTSSSAGNPVTIDSIANPTGVASTSAPQTIQNPLTVQTTGNKALSPSALIDLLAGEDPAGSINTGTSVGVVQLNGNLSDANNLQPLGPNGAAPSSPVPASQTFISSDLRDSPATAQPFTTVTTGALNLSGFSTLLDRLRVGLVSLIGTPSIPRPASESAVWTPLPTYLH